MLALSTWALIIAASPLAKQGVIFVNFDGATIKTGIEDSHSNTTLITDVVELTGGTIPAFGGGETERAAVLAAVKADWAGFGINVTDVRPPAGDYTMNLIGPVYPLGSGVLGIAPVDCGDEQTHNNVTFTFIGSGSGRSPSEIAAVISQEVAHSFGLEHVADGGNIMNPAPAAGDPAFEDGCTQVVGDLVCGPRHAEFCGSQTSQNAVQELFDIFGDGGPDTSPPEVSITSPMDGAHFDVGQKFEIVADATDDNEVMVVELYYFGEPIADDSSAPFSWPADLVEGEHEFYVLARDGAGNEGMSTTVTVVVGNGGPVGGGDGPGSGGDDGGGTGEGGEGGPADDSEDGGADGFAADDPSNDAGCGCNSHGPMPLWMWAAAVLVRRRRVAAVATGALLSAGCAAERDDIDATLGVPYTASAGADDAGETPASDDDGGESEDDAGATGGTGGGGATTGGGDSTDPTAPTNPTIGQGDDGSGSGGSPTGQQPDSGMYSHCLDVMECGPVPICLQIQDNDGVTFDGICTISTCADPAVDCDPSPGGTAQPICISVGSDSDCVLDCSDGKTCPGGMICTNVQTGFICV